MKKEELLEKGQNGTGLYQGREGFVTGMVRDSNKEEKGVYQGWDGTVPGMGQDGARDGKGQRFGQKSVDTSVEGFNVLSLR